MTVMRALEGENDETVPVSFLDHSALPCLHAVELFQDMPAEELRQLNQMLPLTPYSSGDIIYDPRKPISRLFIVKNGRVRIYRNSPSGRVLTLSILEPGSIFGEMPIVGLLMSDNYAEALDDTQLCILTTEQIETNFLGDPRIARRVTSILSRRVMELETRLEDLALRPLPQRLASILLQLGQPSPLPWAPPTPIVRLTHEQLASLIGATREGVSKVLRTLSSEGIISQNRGRIAVIDAEALHDIVDAPIGGSQK